MYLFEFIVNLKTYINYNQTYILHNIVISDKYRYVFKHK